MTEAHDALPEAPPSASPTKMDPETLVLRANPPKTMRFRRGIIISLLAAGAAGVVGTAWYALEPRAGRTALDDDTAAAEIKSPTDALGSLPESYANVPRLGPPLPGDLGRPILERQQQLGGGAPAPETVRLEAEGRERQFAELKTARESGVLIQASHASAAMQGSDKDAAAAPAIASDATERVAIDADRDPNGQQRKADFVRAADKAADTNPYRVSLAPSPFTLSAGSVIPASLITGLRSDLPGLVTAQVTQRVFDSATGRILLVPQGARLVGSYDSVVAFGQRRALVIWQRMLFPDGSSIRLDNAPATDPSGYAGLSDQVDFHSWSLLKGVALSTLLGVAAELQFSGDSDLVEALRRSTQQSVSQAGAQLTSRNLQVQPTITIRPGAPVRLLVHHDIVLKPWQEAN